jgi:3-dehydroquinate dehydratase
LPVSLRFLKTGFFGGPVTKICLCLTGKTIARDLEVLQKHRKHIDMAELRVDCLDPDERLLIRRFPELAGLPVALTIRRQIDGGNFIGGEGSRITLCPGVWLLRRRTGGITLPTWI